MNRIVIKNMRQVQTISDVLHVNKQRFLAELAKINFLVEIKLIALNKMFLWLVNFNNQRMVKAGGRRGSHVHPVQMLFRRMTQLIIAEEIEITKLLVIERALSDSITNIERKIQLTHLFEKLPLSKK